VNAAQQELTTRFMGGALVMTFVIALGIGIGLFLARKKPGQRIVLWPVMVAAVLVMLSVLGGKSNPAIADAGEQQRPNPNAEVFRKPMAPGAVMLFDDRGLRSVEAMASKTIADSTGSPLGDVNSTAQVLEISGGKFLYLKTMMGSSLVGSMIFSGGDGEQVRVVCASRGSVSAKFKGTRCGQVADETFRISVASIGSDI
jgi:hypothetical protein